MTIKPAALVYADAAGKLHAIAGTPAEVSDKVRAMAKGLEPFPKGAVKVWAISGRGIDRQCKPDETPESKPAKGKT